MTCPQTAEFCSYLAFVCVSPNSIPKLSKMFTWNCLGMDIMKLAMVGKSYQSPWVYRGPHWLSLLIRCADQHSESRDTTNETELAGLNSSRDLQTRVLERGVTSGTELYYPLF